MSGLIAFSSQLLRCFLFQDERDEDDKLRDHFDRELTDLDPFFFHLWDLSLIWLDIAMKLSAIAIPSTFLFFGHFQGTDINPIDLL